MTLMQRSSLHPWQIGPPLQSQAFEVQPCKWRRGISMWKVCHYVPELSQADDFNFHIFDLTWGCQMSKNLYKKKLTISDHQQFKINHPNFGPRYLWWIYGGQSSGRLLHARINGLLGTKLHVEKGIVQTYESCSSNHHLAYIRIYIYIFIVFGYGGSP